MRSIPLRGHTWCSVQQLLVTMSDNEANYDGADDGDAAYDVFAQEDDEPQMDEEQPEETQEADMEVVDAGDMSGAGALRAADDRITTKYMTKYERARILGTRALQIRWVLNACVITSTVLNNTSCVSRRSEGDSPAPKCSMVEI